MRDNGWVRTALAGLIICASGGALLWQATDGFRALTSEQLRRRVIERTPRHVPLVALQDQDGATFTLIDYIGQPLAVDFIYTRCRTVCPMLSATFQRIARAEQPRPAAERLVLLSVSFDPSDTPDVLRAYAARHHADGRDWRFARVKDSTELRRLLRAFDIVVIPDGRGDFQHNAAVHILDRHGRLARVLDIDVAPEVVRRAVDDTRRGTAPRGTPPVARPGRIARR